MVFHAEMDVNRCTDMVYFATWIFQAPEEPEVLTAFGPNQADEGTVNTLTVSTKKITTISHLYITVFAVNRVNIVRINNSELLSH